MSFYTNSFGFREPYQVIADGNFLNVCANMKLDPQTALSQVLMGQVRLMTTYCICAELRSLGQDFLYVADEAKRLEKRRCTHKNAISAKECILSIIGEENKFNYCIATQDAELRDSLRDIPGLPLIYANKSVVILEPLSESTLNKIKEKELAKTLPLPFEKSLMKTRKSKTGDKPNRVKKRKIKEPNPLSVKKKKSLVKSIAQEVSEQKLPLSVGITPIKNKTI